MTFKLLFCALHFKLVSVARNLITSLDVGTSSTQTIIAETNRPEGGLQILGVGIAPSFGMRRGVVVDMDDVVHSIRQSVEEAEKAANSRLKSVWLGVGGAHISVSSSRGVVAVSRADGEISPEDVRRALAAAETFIPKNPNKEILHMIPKDFRVDHEPGIKNPVGMHGVRLEVEALVIECSAPFLKNLFKCVEAAGLSVENYVFSPLAAAEAVLTKRQKELGAILLDVGGGTASFIVFEEGVPIHAGVIPIGGAHITNDVAIGFRTHVDVAEQIKLTHGACLAEDLPKKDSIRLAEFMEGEQAVYPRRELAEIIEARLRDIFELLQKELRKISRAQLLPAGVVLVGGSSLLPGMADLTKREMKLPVEFGTPQEFANFVDSKTGPVLATALGIAQWANSQRKEPVFWRSHLASHMPENSILKWLKSLLP